MENVISLKSNQTKVQNAILNTKNLTSGAGYQRPIKQERLKRIISNFDEHKVNPIKVSYREGKYWVFDGQHTLSALKLLNLGEDLMVRCEVHHGLTYEDEARLFSEQNDGVTKVDLGYKIKSLIEAGDKGALEIENAIESVGFIMSFNKSKGDNKIVALGKIQSIYKDLGSTGLIRILNLIKETWEGQSSSLDKEILGGVHYFVKTYKNDFNEDIFVKNLRRVSPIVIKRDGKADTSTKKTDLKYAKQIYEAYNKGLKNKSRLEYLFKG
jgi:hypothetical protein